MAMTDFTIINRSLRARLFGTVVTVLTVAVAVGLMLVLLSMRDAGRQAFARGTGNMDLLISGDQSPMVAVLNGVFYANAPARPIPWEQYGKIRDDPRVGWAIPTQQGDSCEGFPVMATMPEFFTTFEPEPGRAWRLREGRFFTDDFEVVLGSQAARGTGLKIGARISLTHGTSGSREAHVHKEFVYTVVGVLQPTGSAHDRAVFTSLGSTWRIHAHERQEREEGHANENHDEHDAGEAHHEEEGHNPVVELTDEDRRITGVYLKTASRPGAHVSAVLPALAAELRSRTGFTVAAPAGEVGRLFKIVSNIDIVFIAMAAAVMVSSGIGIMLALYNSMESRRRQIAVLRVLGCSRGRVFGLVVTESAVIGLLGAAAGVALAWIGAAATARVLEGAVGLVIRPVFGLESTGGVVAGAVLLASLAGVIPAVMAYRTSVANNLRPIG